MNACHRSSLSAYVDGCRCPGCKEQCKLASARRRNRHRREAGATVACMFCDAVFVTRGALYQHETQVHG
jgi:hypothetical protein